ncbi:hypothetical protein PHMEG_00019727 [Phytophthora megakarya]|uniref:Uncharacterized protein n=1 Tax=Phytophthora megakarya TaxID=4795 RepID=A0A225VSE6_9STRA|nr:hypothetical protein PHMEG_00019727 [Phytophthora megakarya]
MAAFVSNSEANSRKCFVYGSMNHLKATWLMRNYSGKQKAVYTLAVFNTVLTAEDKQTNANYGILDSGSTRHLVNEDRLLEDAKGYSDTCRRRTACHKRGSVLLRVNVRGEPNRVRLEDVQYASNEAQNLISYGVFEAKRFTFVYQASRRFLAPQRGGNAVLDMDRMNNVHVVWCDAVPVNARSSPHVDVIMNVLVARDQEGEDAQVGSLMLFHKR